MIHFRAIPAICDGPISVLSVISCVPPVASVTLRDAERCVTKFIFSAKFNQLSQTFRIFAP